MLARSTLIYAPAILLPRLAAFLIVILLTHTLGPAEFGYYSLVVVVGELLDMGTSNWIRMSMLRLDIGNPGGWRSGFRRCYVLTVCAIGASTLLSAGISMGLASGRFTGFFIALTTYIAANSLNRIGLTSLQMREKRLTYSALEVLRTLAFLAATEVAIQIGVRSFVTFNLVSAAVTAAFSGLSIYLSRRGLPEESAPSRGYLDRLNYGASLIIIGLVSQLILGSDRVLLKLFAGPAAVGIYSAAYVLGRQPVDMIAAAVNQAAFPELMKRYDLSGLDAARRFFQNTWRLQSLLTFGTVAMLWGLAPTLAHALLPAAYRPLAPILIPLIAIGCLQYNAKNVMFDNIFHVFRKNWAQLASYAPAGLVVLAAGVALIPRFGAVGGAAATVIGMSAGLIGSVLMTRRMMPVQIVDGEIVKNLLIAAITGVAAAGSAWLGRSLPPMLDLVIGFVGGSGAWGLGVLILRPEGTEGLYKSLASRIPGLPRPAIAAD
jgi:O-antigen/teichoic acid export membrane protein